MHASDQGPLATPVAGLLPTYALYGEPGRTQATDWLHCERIAERSQRHDWEIRPHRHAALVQILHIAEGTAQAWLDGRSLPLQGPCVLLLPALVPHGFVFAPDIDGTVVTVLEQHLARLLAGTPALAAQLGQAQCCQWPAGAPEAAALQAAVDQLRAEFAASGTWRELALDAALLQLVVQLGRVLPGRSAGAAAVGRTGARALAHVQRLRALVEARFRQQPGLAELAALLGITPTQLNRVCHQVLGHSALGVLHGRLVLEAQRDLAYTTLSIKQIGLDLGFADAAYFTRFFQRETGHTPSAWRAQAAR
jgi:AraC family transcriptional activator of pobA